MSNIINPGYLAWYKQRKAYYANQKNPRNLFQPNTLTKFKQAVNNIQIKKIDNFLKKNDIKDSGYHILVEIGTRLLDNGGQVQDGDYYSHDGFWDTHFTPLCINKKHHQYIITYGKNDNKNNACFGKACSDDVLLTEIDGKKCNFDLYWR